MNKYKIGDGVTRQKYRDDGTWAKQGDFCLVNSPLRNGTIAMITSGIPTYYMVDWNDGTSGNYLTHGINPV